jgi:Cellulose biosynthesis protein BcsN
MAAEIHSWLKCSGLKAVVALALIAPLQACVLNNPLDRQLTSAVILEPSPLDGYQYELAQEVPLSRAFVELPSMSGAMIAVREKRYANGIEQTMVLESEAAADGENRIEVRITQPGKADSRIKNEYLQVRNTRQEQIRSDMKEFVWGIPMKIVGSVEANAYGTYGYALGRSKLGFNCLLGWQNVKGVMKERRLLGFTTTSFTEMSVRLRICRTDLNPDQLVSIIRGMRITVDPAALMQEPKMIWRNEGYNVSGAQSGNGTVPGYVTEGVALPEGGVASPAEIATIDPQPAVNEPVYQSSPKAAKPRSSVQNSQPRGPQPAKPKKRPLIQSEDDLMVSNEDADQIPNLDKNRNRTKIYIDPREYAAVPTPGDQGVDQSVEQGLDQDINEDVGQGTIAPQPVISGKPSAAAKSMVKPVGKSGIQSKSAREKRKEQIRQIPLGTEALGNVKTDRNGANASASRNGRSENYDLFLAPEREGYRGLKIEEIQRQTRAGKKDTPRNLWLNDVARSDQDGMPLGRPCELLRDKTCDEENKDQ